MTHMHCNSLFLMVTMTIFMFFSVIQSLAGEESPAVIDSARTIETAVEYSNCIAIGTFTILGQTKGRSFRPSERIFGAARLSIDSLLCGKQPSNVDVEYRLDDRNPSSSLLKTGEKYILFLDTSSFGVRVIYAVPYAEKKVAEVRALLPKVQK